MPKALAVYRQFRVYMVFTWEVMFEGFCAKGTVTYPNIHHYWRKSPKFLDENTKPRFHAVGMSISYTDSQSDFGGTAAVQEPRNDRYDFYEEEAQKMFSKWCCAHSSDPSDIQGLHLEETLAFLEMEPSPTSIKGKLLGRFLSSFRRSALKGARVSITSPISKPVSSPTVEDVVAFSKQFPIDILLEIVPFLPRRQLKDFSLASSLCHRIAGPVLWQTFNMHWDGDSGSISSLESLFSALARNAPYVQTLSLRCGWTWTDQRINLFADALSRLESLSYLSLKLQTQWMSRSSSMTGGEYRPLFRLLAEKGHHLRLRRLDVDHLARLDSFLIPFLETQTDLEHLEGLSFTKGREVILPVNMLPNLCRLSANSAPTISGLVPGRPISHFTLLGAMFDTSFLDSLEKSTSKTLRVFVVAWVTGDANITTRQIMKRLLDTEKTILELQLSSCIVRPGSYPELERFDALEQLVISTFQGAKLEFKQWLGTLSPTLQHVGTDSGNMAAVRNEDGLWTIDYESSASTVETDSDWI